MKCLYDRAGTKKWGRENCIGRFKSSYNLYFQFVENIATTNQVGRLPRQVQWEDFYNKACARHDHIKLKVQSVNFEICQGNFLFPICFCTSPVIQAFYSICLLSSQNVSTEKGGQGKRGQSKRAISATQPPSCFSLHHSLHPVQQILYTTVTMLSEQFRWVLQSAGGEATQWSSFCVRIITMTKYYSIHTLQRVYNSLCLENVVYSTYVGLGMVFPQPLLWTIFPQLQLQKGSYKACVNLF